MDILLYGDNEQRANYFRNKMDRELFGSRNYEQARKIYAWLCSEIRKRAKTEQMGIVR